MLGFLFGAWKRESSWDIALSKIKEKKLDNGNKTEELRKLFQNIDNQQDFPIIWGLLPTFIGLVILIILYESRFLPQVPFWPSGSLLYTPLLIPIWLLSSILLWHRLFKKKRQKIVNQVKVLLNQDGYPEILAELRRWIPGASIFSTKLV